VPCRCPLSGHPGRQVFRCDCLATRRGRLKWRGQTRTFPISVVKSKILELLTFSGDRCRPSPVPRINSLLFAMIRPILVDVSMYLFPDKGCEWAFPLRSCAVYWYRPMKVTCVLLAGSTTPPQTLVSLLCSEILVSGFKRPRVALQ